MFVSALWVLASLAHATDEAPAPMLTLTPSFIPAGLGARIHQPTGAHSAVSVGGSLASAVFDDGDTTPVRGTIDLGADLYPMGQFHGLYFGPRATVALWTAPPVLGGSNLNGGFALGGRARFGEGASFGVEAGMRVHKYFDYHLTEGSDGVQVLPQVQFDVGMPMRRRTS